MTWPQPPGDHGSTRHGYVELIGAPEGVQPPDDFVESLFCPDCASNLFLTYVESLDAVHAVVWQPKIAHDETCPHLAAIEAQS